MIGPKEQIHDEQLAPLILDIDEICKRHGIDMLMSFELDDTWRPGVAVYASTARIKATRDPGAIVSPLRAAWEAMQRFNRPGV